MLRLNLGEVLSIRSPTGGGFGDPLERLPASVLADVRSGYVTATSARDDYGVIVANDEVDATASAAVRKEMRAARAAAPRRETVSGAWPAMFDGGEGRATHDRTFPPVVADRMVELLFSIPPAARYYAKQQLFARLREIPLAEGRGLSREDLETVWTEFRPRLGLRAEAKLT